MREDQFKKYVVEIDVLVKVLGPKSITITSSAVVQLVQSHWLPMHRN